jgi:hypothetical protein
MAKIKHTARKIFRHEEVFLKGGEGNTWKFCRALFDYFHRSWDCERWEQKVWVTDKACKHIEGAIVFRE